MNCKKVFCSQELEKIRRMSLKVSDLGIDLRLCNEERVQARKERDAMQETVGLLETQISLLHGQIPVPPPSRVDMGTLGVNSIIDVLVDLWGMEYIIQGHAQVTWPHFQATTIDCLMEFVRWTGVDKLKYTSFHICADYAYGLMGRTLNTPGWWGTPLGVLDVSLPGSTDWHTINLAFACPNEDTPVARAYFIEPQEAMLLNYGTMASLIPMDPETTLEEMREPGVVGQLILT